jgi:hypothetical protein
VPSKRINKKRHFPAGRLSDRDFKAVEMLVGVAPNNSEKMTLQTGTDGNMPRASVQISPVRGTFPGAHTDDVREGRKVSVEYSLEIFLRFGGLR